MVIRAKLRTRAELVWLRLGWHDARSVYALVDRRWLRLFLFAFAGGVISWIAWIAGGPWGLLAIVAFPILWATSATRLEAGLGLRRVCASRHA